MKATLRYMIALGAVLALATAAAVPGLAFGDREDDDDNEGQRQVGPPRFSNPTRIENPFLPVTKFRRCVLEGEEGGAEVRTVRRLLERTEPFDFGGHRVQTTVIEDRAFEDGELVERTLDYFAQADDGTVYYFGEDVDNYENGQVVDHSGSWRFGRDTDRLGVAMPPEPEQGDTWLFEDVPGITIERDRVVGEISRMRINGKVYEELIRIREFLVLERQTEFKLYAEGFGVVRESPPGGRVELVGCER